MSKLLLNPSSPNTLIVATSSGIYRTTDGGVTFSATLDTSTSLTLGGNFKDMEFKPGDPTTVYACGSSFYKSTNGGTSWTTNTDLLNHVIGCTDLAIDPTNPNIMYLATGDGDAIDLHCGHRRAADRPLPWHARDPTVAQGLVGPGHRRPRQWL